MKRRVVVVLGLLAMATAVAARAQAQTGSAANVFAGSVPNGVVSPEPLPLSLAAALDRGLKYNLGVVSLEEQIDSARGARIRSLRALMPRVDARLDESRQTRNLAAFGFDAS